MRDEQNGLLQSRNVIREPQPTERETYENRIKGKKTSRQRVVDHAEDCCIGSDAQRQRQHRDDREARRSYQVPQTVTRVLKEGFHVIASAIITPLEIAR